MGCNQDDAEHIAQTTLLNAFASIHQFQGGEIRAWLFTIARNVHYSRYRHDAHGPIYTDDPPEVAIDPPQDEAIEAMESSVRLAARIAKLSPAHREVLALLLEGAEYLEISEALALPLGTVKSRLDRARYALRAQV